MPPLVQKTIRFDSSLQEQTLSPHTQPPTDHTRSRIIVEYAPSLRASAPADLTTVARPHTDRFWLVTCLCATVCAPWATHSNGICTPRTYRFTARRGRDRGCAWAGGVRLDEVVHPCASDATVTVLCGGHRPSLSSSQWKSVFVLTPTVSHPLSSPVGNDQHVRPHHGR
ncbi:hypothetical protein DFH94DRAFT_201301 [Russula ochroleuca]|uniref:Uncharacterized protein n=1 Tax=Russula ochroleuca TaxID=152965 RepID=A0A9P5MR49_9AGAM|nr:hypothetical protein DFH94DRAFT_201301 [Russula ochroleuca]